MSNDGLELPDEFGSDVDSDNRMKSIFEVPDEVKAEVRAHTLKEVAGVFDREIKAGHLTIMLIHLSVQDRMGFYRLLDSLRNGIMPGETNG